MGARTPFKDHQSFSLTKKLLPWALYALIPLIFIRLYLYPIPIVQSQRSQDEFQYAPFITTSSPIVQSQKSQDDFDNDPVVTTSPPVFQSQTSQEEFLTNPITTTSPPPPPPPPHILQSQNNPIVSNSPPLTPSQTAQKGYETNPIINTSPPFVQSQKGQEDNENTPIITTSPPVIQSHGTSENITTSPPQNKNSSISITSPPLIQSHRNNTIITTPPPIVQPQNDQKIVQNNPNITTLPPAIQSQETHEEVATSPPLNQAKGIQKDFQNKSSPINTTSSPPLQSLNIQGDNQNSSNITSAPPIVQSQKGQKDFEKKPTIPSSTSIVQSQKSQKDIQDNSIITSKPPVVQPPRSRDDIKSNPITTIAPILLPSQVKKNFFQNNTIITTSSPSTSPSPVQENRSKSNGSAPCDYFNGKWVRDMLGPLYNGTTCGTIKDGQNCITHGRPDMGYLYWRWRPKQCRLPRFNSSTFLDLHKNKHLAFIGDSMARNQLESLLCLLSSVSTPDLVYTREENKFRRWNFPSHNINVSLYWSPFLVKGIEKSSEFNYNKLFLDSVDDRWAGEMDNFDVIVLSIGHWFLHPAVYYDKEVLLGCHYCPGLNYTEIGFYDVYRKAFNTTLRTIIERRGSNNTVNVIVTTFSPAHFEGEWDKIGACAKIKPYKEGEKELGWMDTEMRKMQLEEVERAKGNAAPMTGLKFEALDVTRLANMRPDGHPGPYMNPFPFADGVKDHVQNDCVHWCLPGPIDTWNEILLEIAKKW